MIPTDRISLLQMVSDYVGQGWSPVPVARGQKAPKLKGWPSLRLKEHDLAEHFGRDANVGIILGQSSSWLVDVDLDSPEAVNFADRFLPPTGAVFGRTSKPRSHRLYYCRGVKTEQFQDPIDNKMVVEIRSGPGPLQTIFPPSIHPSGEQIKWAASEEPASVEPQRLRRCVSLLASYCLLVRYLHADQAPPGDVSPDSWLYEGLPPEIRVVAIEWAGVSGRSSEPPIGAIQPMPIDIYVTLDPADKPAAMDKIAQVDAVQRYIEQAGYKIKRPAPYHLKYGRISYFPTKMKIMIDGDPKPLLSQSPDDFLRLIRAKRI
jgi:hypothetical protein